MDQIVGMVVFVSSLCAFVHFSHGAWRALVSPEFKRDLERLRYQRRMRKAARRRM